MQQKKGILCPLPQGLMLRAALHVILLVKDLNVLSEDRLKGEQVLALGSKSACIVTGAGAPREIFLAITFAPP